MKSEYKKAFLFIFLYIVLISITWYVTKEWISIQTIAIILTGIIVIWYTVETKMLRFETQRQTEVSLRPFIVFEILNDHFSLRNLGTAPALNVKIRPVQVDANESIIIQFPDLIPSIMPGKSVEVRAESFKKGKSAGDFFLAHIDPSYANRTLTIKIDYQNIELHKYTTKEKISPKKREITEFEY